MVEFLIDTPTHKRWVLPDGEHEYNSVIYGKWLQATIWRKRDNQLVLSLPAIALAKPDWQRLSETAQALAERKFRAKNDRRRDDYMRSYRR